MQSLLNPEAFSKQAYQANLGAASDQMSKSIISTDSWLAATKNLRQPAVGDAEIQVDNLHDADSKKTNASDSAQSPVLLSNGDDIFQTVASGVSWAVVTQENIMKINMELLKQV